MGLINKNNLPLKQESPQSPFTKEEMEILLRIIAEGTFKGKEIQVVYDLVYKLQQMYLDK
jgi:hypothetical protein